MSVIKEPDQTLHHVLDIISDGVWDWNIVTGQVIRNPGWYRMLGYEIHSFKQDVLTWENLIHPDDHDRVMGHFEAYVQGLIPEYNIQYRCLKGDGSFLWIEDSGRIVERSAEGSPQRMIGAHTNIHAQKTLQQKLEEQSKLLRGEYENLDHIIQERTKELDQLNQQLARKVEEVEMLASRDALTGIYNRRMFESFLDIEIKRAKRYSQPMCVILADIDLFKHVNDRYGHSSGDKVLVEVALTLQQHLRESDYLARWGGEEFAIILPNTATKVAMETAERLRHEVESLVTTEGISVTCSFGVTQFHQKDCGTSIFSRMDQALYMAKDQNRNTVRLIPPRPEVRA